MYLKMGSYLSGNFLKGPKCDENETKNCVIIKKKDGNLDVCSLRTQVTAHCWDDSSGTAHAPSHSTLRG